MIDVDRRRGLGFGVLMFPIHRPDHDPTLQLEDDLALAELCDRLGYDEFWFGEHHSGGWQIIGAPELMVAAAAQRTSRIRLGTGVSTLAYHHPFTLTDRLVQLDHLTRGRLIFGVGAGALAQDAAMMGIDPMTTRGRMVESLEAIQALLAGRGPVTRRTDWFELCEAELQLRPYADPLDLRVAAFRSPSGPRLAGRFGTGMVSFGASASIGSGAENPMTTAWDIVEQQAAKFGTEVDRRRWSVMSPIHVADTEEEARRQVRWGLRRYLRYVSGILPFNLPVDLDDLDAAVDLLHTVGHGVIGTPQMAIEHIEQMLSLSGGFGTFLIEQADWARPADTAASYDLFARAVMPHFTGQCAPRLAAHRRELAGEGRTRRTMAAAQARAGVDHAAEVSAERRLSGAGSAAGTHR